MTIQYSLALRNNQLVQIESTIGETPTIELRSGPRPENCAAADTGVLLALFNLPEDWLTTPTTGSLAMLGVWTTTGLTAGAIGHFRVKHADGTCHMQGVVTLVGDGGDMTVDNTSIGLGQEVTIKTFGIIAGNA